MKCAINLLVLYFDMCNLKLSYNPWLKLKVKWKSEGYMTNLNRRVFHFFQVLPLFRQSGDKAERFLLSKSESLSSVVIIVLCVLSTTSTTSDIWWRYKLPSAVVNAGLVSNIINCHVGIMSVNSIIWTILRIVPSADRAHRGPGARATLNKHQLV